MNSLVCFSKYFLVKISAKQVSVVNWANLSPTFPGTFSIILLKASPKDKDYEASHIILGIICLIVLYIVTCIYIFKLDGTKKKNANKVLTLLGIGLIPTLLFSLFYFLTNLQLILYIFILILLIIPYIIISKNILRKRLKNKILKLKDFDKDKFNNEVFEVYKSIQIAWMNFDYIKLKELVSNDIYNKYQKQ